MRSNVFREEQTFDAPPIEPPPPEEIEYEVNLEQRNQESSPPRPNPIVVDTQQDIDLPALDIDVNVNTSSSYGRGGGGFGSGTGGSIREMAIQNINLFGVDVEASNLGVILDISFSTHKHIDEVLDEIQKGFPDAKVVFTPGCTLRWKQGELFPLSEYTRATEKYPLPQTERRVFATEAFIARLREENRDFVRIWKDVEREERGQILFSPVGKRAALTSNNIAFEHLIGEGVDAIYWFADFDDVVDSKVAEELAKDLRRRRIKVYIHDFVPPLGPSKGDSKQVQQSLSGMADETEGKFFLKVLD